MRIRLVFFFFMALALKAVGQNEVQQLYPCLNDSSEVVPGCVAISLGYGQYCEAVRDTSYCSGDTLFTKYVAANSFLAISQGDSVYMDTIYNGCSGTGGGADGFIVLDSITTIGNDSITITIHYTDEAGNQDSIFSIFEDSEGLDEQTLSFSNPNLSISNGNTVNLSSLDTDTQLSQEQVQDFVGTMVNGNTETLINVTYDDPGNEFDFVVEDDLSLYDNTTSGFITNADDADADPNNEIQSISIDSTGRVFTITLTSGGSVTFEDTNTQDGTGTDDQNLDVGTFNTGTGDLTIGIEDGTDQTINLDGRYSTTDNDNQTLTWNGTNGQITISSGNTIDIDGRYLQTEVDGSTTNELQDLSWSAGTGGNDEITLSDGGGTVTITDDVNDADADPSNEFQTMSIDSSGRVFTITLTDGNSISFEDTGTDGNGIYDGSGTVPSGVDVSLTDNISFADSVFYIDHTNRKIQTDDTLYFGDKWTMFASNDGDSLSIQSINSGSNFRIFGDGGEEFFDLGTALGGLQLYGYRTASVANRDDAIQQVAHFTSTGFLKRTSVETLADSIEQYLQTSSDDQTIDTFELSGTDLRLSIESDSEAFKTVNLSSLQDGNGIYDGDGTTPTDLEITATDSVTILGTGGNYSPILRVRKTGTGSYIDFGTGGANNDATISAFTSSTGGDGRIFLRQYLTEDVYVGDIGGNGGAVRIRSSGFDHLIVDSDGSLDLPDYGSGSNTGALAYILGVTSGGDLIETTASDDQTISTNGTAGNISIESGNTITLNVDDADASTTNEIQDVNVSSLVGSDDIRVGLTPTSLSRKFDLRPGANITMDIVGGGDVIEVGTADEGLDTVYITLTHTHWNDTITETYSDDYFVVPPSMDGWRIKEQSLGSWSNADGNVTVGYAIRQESNGTEYYDQATLASGTDQVTETYSFGFTVSTGDLIRVKVNNTGHDTEGLSMTLMISEP